MQASLRLLNKRRFLPLFVTQLLGAFNDNLFKNAMVLFVVYQVYNSERDEFWFSAVTTAVFILPFFLLSALAGQLADAMDKAKIIRIVKLAEIVIMLVGGAGLAMAWMGIAVHGVAIPLLLLALFAMGVHSTFFGPIKYSILPQHLEKDEVLGGTGLVEAGTYMAILGGTILAGVIDIEISAVLVILIAIVGYISGRKVPPAPAKKLVKPKRERSSSSRGARPVAGGGDRQNRLGRKWSCFKCGAKFYDLNHPEPLCPKCGTDQRTRPKDQPNLPPPPPPRPREPRPLALLDDDDATRDDEALGPEDLD